MYKTIVVGTDGSATASEAVRQAAELARLCGGALHVVCAYGSAKTASALAFAGAGVGAVPVNPVEIEDELRQHADAVLSRSLPSHLIDGIDVTRHPRPGEPSDAIVDVAEEEHADVIVVGNRGMTGARRFLLGSVPNRVAHSAPCNVLIVHTT